MLYGRIVLIRALSATFLQPEGDQGPLAEAQRRAAGGRLLAGEPGDRRDGRRDVDGGGVDGGRGGRDAGAVAPGEGALAALLSRSAADPRAYAYVVGESALATRGRRHLHAAGLPKDRITFSGYWKR